MEKFIEYLYEAERKLQTVDHIVYVTLPLVNDKKLLLKVLSELHQITLKYINAVLQFDYLYKKINLTADAHTNLKIFKEKCAPRYKITEIELKLITDLMELSEKHKKSPFEFVRQEKIVIMSENMKPETLTIERIKGFLANTKSVLRKIKEIIKLYQT